jgi:hypothetical protein
MKLINTLLIGYGKMGKKFAKEVKKNKKFSLVKIITTKNNKLIDISKFDLVIISSPVETHYKYLRNFMHHNKDIIVEKPVVKNLDELLRLKKKNKSYNGNILIHHNDVLNLEKSKHLFKRKKIQLIKIKYGKKIVNKIIDNPHLDWLPHPLAVIHNFFGKPKRFKILNYKKVIKNDNIKENLIIIFYLNKYDIYLEFSNDLDKPTKQISFTIKNKTQKIYDGYDKKNQRSIKLLLTKYMKNKKINDLSTNMESYILLFKISRKLKKFKN